MKLLLSQILLFIFPVIVTIDCKSWPWSRPSNRPLQKKSWRFLDSQESHDNLRTQQQQQQYSHTRCKAKSECARRADNSSTRYLFNKHFLEQLDLDDLGSENLSNFQLFNGTSINIHEDKLTNLLESHLRDSFATNLTKVLDASKINENLIDFAFDTTTPSINDTQSRIIALQINAKNRTGNQKYPTVTLAQIARKVMFPDWLFSLFRGRFGSNRKIGVEGLNITNTKGSSSAPAIFSSAKLPSLTFDNNFSRYLRLLNIVRFPNAPCADQQGLNGTCYHSQECATLGGTSSSSCASGFGVCCIFRYSCGDITAINRTYFVDTGMTYSSTGVTTCNLEVRKTSPNVKQIRLDFEVLSLAQPNAGSCDQDRFVVSGQNINNVIPILCGTSNDTHIYVETEGPSSGIQLSIMTSGDGQRKWRIRITQYETGSPSKAPDHCLQYYSGVMGTVQSFNYKSNISPQYLNNLNYAICIRKEAGFCSVTFTNAGPDGTYMPFQVVNANENGELVIPSGQSGVGVRDCPYDFILINGYRLCGERFNDATTNILYVEDAPVTDLSSGPFIVSVRTNELDVGGGFFLYYRQNPCMSIPG